MNKTCFRCRLELPEDAFTKRASSKDGLNSWCRECVKKRSKLFREEHPEYGKERYKKDPESVKRSNKLSYKRNVERRRAASLLHREKNIEKVKEQKRKYSSSHKEERNAKARLRRKNDPLFRLQSNLRRRRHHALKGNIKKALLLKVWVVV